MINNLSTKAALATVVTVLIATSAFGRNTQAGGLRLTQAWAQPTPMGAAVGVGYLTISNSGKGSDRLLGATSAAATRVELHDMSLAGGIMRMEPVKGGIAVPPGRSVRLAPNGYHLMLIGLRRPLAAGGTVPVTLRFERAGYVVLALDVRTTPPVSNKIGNGQ